MFVNGINFLFYIKNCMNQCKTPLCMNTAAQTVEKLPETPKHGIFAILPFSHNYENPLKTNGF